MREWGAYYDLDRPVLLEKSPPNLIRSRFQRRMIPGSKFVFIVCHPIVVALARGKWSDKSIGDLILHWHRAYSIMLSDIDNADDCLVMRYEDLVKTLQTVSSAYAGWPVCLFSNRPNHARKAVHESGN